jgi:DNA integrity scanning protein DisA with diadenylate cyclase activity
VEPQSRPSGPNPGQLVKVIGLYQMLLRRGLAHFLPEGELQTLSDRSVLRLPSRRNGGYFSIADDDSGLGLELDWFGTPYRFAPTSPVPFSQSQRRLVQVLCEVLDHRFRSMYEPDSSHIEDLIAHEIEDLTVARFLDVPWPERIPYALEALRIAALSTYENRRLSTGVLLLGTPFDPAAPDRPTPAGSPRYDEHLGALKTIHRLCDGVRTLLTIDHEGCLGRPIDIDRWVRSTQKTARLEVPTPRLAEPHARATASGQHVAIVLTQNQEIAVFAHGCLQFLSVSGRWRLLDLQNCFNSWSAAIGRTRPASLAHRVFQAALNLSHQRRGALFVVLRNPRRSVGMLLAPEDRILDEPAHLDPDIVEDTSFRHAKRTLHHLTRDSSLADLDDAVLEALAGLDGAVVLDRQGQLLSYGAILRVTPETILAPRAIQGARTTAALAASYHGPVLKVSEDGFLAMYLGGRRIWEI